MTVIRLVMLAATCNSCKRTQQYAARTVTDIPPGWMRLRNFEAGMLDTAHHGHYCPTCLGSPPPCPECDGENGQHIVNCTRW